MEYTFREKVKTLLILIKEPKVLSKLLSLRLSGYLMDVGWFNAFKAGEPIGKNSEPLPWVTYSFIDFISERLNKDFSIFEFGSGNSTLFFAERVKNVTTVEHNADWYNKLKEKLPGNVGLILSKSDLKEDYLDGLKKSDKNYDIIFSDIRMPDLDGLGFLENLKKINKSLAGRVVFITGDSMFFESPGNGNGMKNLVLTKPFTMDDVKKILQEFANYSQ